MRNLRLFVLLLAAVLLASCKTDSSNSFGYEDVLWDNVGNYPLVENSFNSDDFKVVLKDDERGAITILLLDKNQGQLSYDGIKYILNAEVGEMVKKSNETLSFIGESNIIKLADPSIKCARLEYRSLLSSHGFIGVQGFIDLVNIGNALFFVDACTPNGSDDLDILKKTSESVHLASPSKEQTEAIDSNESAKSLNPAKLTDAYVLHLCNYIPDHKLLPEAQNYMTGEFFSILASAFDAPTGAYTMIGNNEFLYYFVTGNGGSELYFEVASITTTDDTHAVASISVRDVWEKGGQPTGNPRFYHLYLSKEDGRWLIDDFDGKKQECKLWVDSMRRKYKSGAIIDWMWETDQSEYIPRFKQELNEWYGKYGR